MTYVITQPCIGVKDGTCIDVCPMDCIHGPKSLEEIRAIPMENRKDQLDRIQMFVNPGECIGCWACVTVCPVNAIFEDMEIPEEWSQYIKANAQFFASDGSD